MHYTWNYLPVPSSLATGDPGTYTYTVRIKGHKSIPIKKSWLSKTCFVFSSIFVLSPKMTPSWRWNDSSFACSPILIKYTSLFQSIKAGLASRSKLCVQCEYWNGATQKSIKEAIRTVGIESLRGWNPNRALDNAGHWFPLPQTCIECLDLNSVLLVHSHRAWVVDVRMNQSNQSSILPWMRLYKPFLSSRDEFTPLPFCQREEGWRRKDGNMEPRRTLPTRNKKERFHKQTNKTKTNNIKPAWSNIQIKRETIYT